LGGLIGGGWGAKFNEDGMSATIAINDGDTHNGPSEQVEAKYPLLVEKYQLRPDSGGAGTFRGGLGTEQTIRVMSDIMFNTQIERVECRPWGLFGGLSAFGNEVCIQRKGEEEVVYKTGKVFSQTLRSGDAWTLRSGGGGGYGTPTERNTSSVEDDVRNGYVSGEMAHKLYGVVLDAKTGRAQATATAELRDYMRANHLPVDQPYTSQATDPGGTDPQLSRRVRQSSPHQALFSFEAREFQAEVRAAGLLVDRCCS
jgi:N-methylhydantoinase B